MALLANADRSGNCFRKKTRAGANQKKTGNWVGGGPM